MKGIKVDILRINNYNSTAVGQADGFQSMQETGVVGSVCGRLDEYKVGKIRLTGIGESRGKGCGVWVVGCILGDGKIKWICDVHVAVPCVRGYAGVGRHGTAKTGSVSSCKDGGFRRGPCS